MKDKALELIEKIEANISVCCAVTMDPDEVLEMVEELKQVIEKI